MALSAIRNTPSRSASVRAPISLSVKGTTTCYEGGLAVISGGYVAPGTAATGLLAAGRFHRSADNSAGADGAIAVEVESGTFKWANSANADAIAQADVGNACYIVDDQTVAKTDGGGARSVAGMIVAVESSGVWVDTYPSLAALAATGAVVGTVTDSSVIGGIPVVHTIPIADGATADTDVVLTYKTEILDVIVQKRAGAGGASDTITVKNGASAVSNAMSINVADQTIVRAGTIDDAQSTIAAAGTLRITRTKVSGANVACLVTIIGVRRA